MSGEVNQKAGVGRSGIKMSGSYIFFQTDPYPDDSQKGDGGGRMSG